MCLQVRRSGRGAGGRRGGCVFRGVREAECRVIAQTSLSLAGREVQHMPCALLPGIDGTGVLRSITQ